MVLAVVLGCGGAPVEPLAPKPAPSSVPVAKAAPPPTAPTSKQDYIAVFSAYAPGENDSTVTTAAKALLVKADEAAFHGDEALGRAVLGALERVNFADPKSSHLGLLFSDLLSALAPAGIAKELVAIVQRPNSGVNSVEVKRLTMLQVVAAEVLGVVGDASVVPAMADRMFVLAATMAPRKDPTTGDEVVVASSLTTGVSRILASSLARIGAPSIPALLPYVKADLGDPRVKAVAALFADHVSESGARPELYVEIAIGVLADVGLPRLAVEVAAAVKDKGTKDDVRRRLLGLLVSLPPTPAVLDAFREGFAATVHPDQRVLVVASASRTLSPALTAWLLGIATAKGASVDLARAALGSATWLATKADLPAVTKAYGKQGLAQKDLTWTTMEATTTPCDPKTIKDPKQKDLCNESPEGGGRVLFKNVTPTVAEVHAQVAEVLACDKDAACYLAALKKSAAAVDKMGFTKVTLAGTLAMIRAQKAFTMLAAFGAEADLVALVDLFPSLQSPALRSFGQRTLDHSLASGAQVAEAIEKLVQRLQAEGSEIAQREAMQLGPIARKLRTRAKNP